MTLMAFFGEMILIGVVFIIAAIVVVGLTILFRLIDSE
jgi:hypothetical protein